MYILDMNDTAEAKYLHYQAAFPARPHRSCKAGATLAL